MKTQRSRRGKDQPVSAPAIHNKPKAPAAGGQALPAGTQAHMGAAFGHDFSSVRVFADEAAAESAQGMDAAAYAVGGDLFFNRGFYQPDTGDGRHLLAHELTHVVQQARFGTSGAQPSRAFSDPADPAEREAGAVAGHAAAGRRVEVKAAPSAAVSRFDLGGWVRHTASDAWHGAEHLASGAAQGVSHFASNALHGAEHLGAGVVHGAEHLGGSVLHGVQHAGQGLMHGVGNAWHGAQHLAAQGLHGTEHLAAQGLHGAEHLAAGLGHGVSGLAHGVAGGVGHAWDNASHFASHAAHGLGHMAQRGLHGAEHLASGAWNGARHLGGRVLHGAEHLAAEGLHGAEHLGMAAAHGVGHAWDNARHSGSGALHGAEHLAARGLHGAEHLALGALHGAEHAGSSLMHGAAGLMHGAEGLASRGLHGLGRLASQGLHGAENAASGAWDGVKKAVGPLPSLHDLGDAASEQFAPLLNAQSPWEALKAEGSIAYNGMKTAGGWVKSAGEGVTHGIDWLEDKEAAGTNWLAGKAKGIPVLEQLAGAGKSLVDTQTQLTGGVLKGATGLVEGVAGMVVNPVDTLGGLEAMGEHIPTLGGLIPNPLKAAHGLLNVATGHETWGQLGQSLDPEQSAKEDGKFWKTVGSGLIGQYSDAWKKGKYADVIGHAGFDVGTFFTGLGEANAAAKTAEVAKFGEAGKLADAAEIGEAARVGETSEAAKAAEAARVSAHPGAAYDPLLSGALPDAQRGKGVAVFSGPGVGGDGVRVVTHGPDGRPLPTLEVHAGPDATAAHVAEHVQTVEDLQKYQGLGGRVRGAVDRVKEAVGVEGTTPPKGTRAFEAQHEVSKLDGMIARRREQLRVMGEGDGAAERLRAQIEDLSSQRAQHAQALADHDLSPGRGFVEAKGAQRTETIAGEKGLPNFQKDNPGYTLREKNNRVEVVAPKGGEKRVLDPITGEVRPQFRNGAEAAKSHGLPEAEEGYHWALNGEDQPVYKRRSVLPDEDGLVPAERRFNPETREFEDAGGLDARARYKPGSAETVPLPKDKARAAQYEKVMQARSKAVAERDALLDRMDRIDSKPSLSPQEALERQQVEQDLSRSHGRVNEQSRQLGEMGVEDYMRVKHPDAVRVYGGPQEASRAGDFDQVWRSPPNPGAAGPGEEIMISAEAKGGSAGLGSRKVQRTGPSQGRRVEQGTPEYFDDIAAGMERSKALEAGGPHAGENVGRNLAAAAEDGNARYLHIKVPIKKGAGGSPSLGGIEAREFDLSPRSDVPEP